MWAFFERLLDSSMLSPHGICLLWEPELIWLHVVADACIAAAYFSIPFALAILVTKRRDLKFGWVYWAFAIFIMACGLTHVLSIYTLWVPIYGIEGIVKAATAVASVVTAGALWPLLPKILTIPSPFELRQVQAALEEEEIKTRDATLLLQQVRDAQRAMRESVARLTAIVETAVDGVILLDAQDRILLFNPACERLFGYSADEVMSRNVGMLMPEAGAGPDSHASHFATAGEAIGLRKDGSTFPMDVSVGQARQDGELIFVGIVHDLTARKLTEQQLQQAQKMETVGQLSGGIAHDFNNLLTVIIGNAEHMSEQLKARPDLRRFADDICQSGERGAELTQRLLAFSRRQLLQPQMIDCRGLLDSMFKLLKRTLREDIEIRTSTGPGTIVAFADRAQLESAVLNLALNAQDAMPAGGHLTLSTELTAIDEDYCTLHPEVAAGAYALISITDDGEGMTPDVIARAFEPFFTTKEVGKGSGLGLSMLCEAIRRPRLDLQRDRPWDDGPNLSAARGHRTIAGRPVRWRGRGAARIRDDPDRGGRSVRPFLRHSQGGSARISRRCRGQRQGGLAAAAHRPRHRHAVHRYRDAGRHERLGALRSGAADSSRSAGPVHLGLRTGDPGRAGPSACTGDRADQALSQGRARPAAQRRICRDGRDVLNARPASGGRQVRLLNRTGFGLLAARYAFGVPAMVPFFVQIKCKLGQSYTVANALAEAEIASEIYSTAGQYDLLVKFYVDKDTDIGHFVNEKVQVLPGIQDTLTIITFKAFGAS